MPDDSAYDEEAIRHAYGIQYQFQDFLRDIGLIAQIAKSFPVETGIDSLRSAFDSNYGDSAEDKMARCLAAYSYWEMNKEAFNVGGITVVGDDATLVHGHFIMALWIRWCRADCDWRTYNPPVSEIIADCNQINET